MEKSKKRRSGEAKKLLGSNKKAEEAVVENQNEEDDLYNMHDDEEGGTYVGGIYIPPPIKPYCSTESKGPRLIITKIENVNFKSYAGKVVLGPFHHCFTAIIGPNGSGKSNVIDSMLFVFGYRAQKIRCKKLSVLLHNSAKCPNTQMCMVAVHFKQIIDKENGNYEDVPNSEIVIARTAFKDNSSYYTINGRRVQFKEVSKLLKEHGIDLDHNRFLILQGEVESIAMMKSKAQNENECGMLEYLEDIIGTKRYKEPLEQISARVENLTEERTEKHNRCKLAEREMKDLEQPYNEAIDHLKKENEFYRAQNKRYQKALSEENKKLLEFEEEANGVKNELQEHDDTVNNLIKQKEELENSIKENHANYTKLCKTKDELEKKYTKATNNYTETQNTMEATNKRRKQNQEQIKKLEAKIEELKSTPVKNQDEIAECEKKIEKLTKEKSTLEEQLQKNYKLIEDQTRPFIDEREKLETELIDKKKIVEEAKAELSLAESELKILQHDETTEKCKYESLRSSFEESKQSLEEQSKQLEELKTNIPQIKIEIDQKTIELENCVKEQKILQNKFQSYRAEINEKKMSMQAAKSNNKVLDFLMKQKFEGNIPGILGRLGDLGGIDAKYDVAISTACGRLDNIVVDTVNTAQACIEYLKRYDVGRASFIALEKVQHLQRYCTSKISTPENVPRLFDLVRVEDERVLPAFYFALRNTLVANELDQGTRIAYGAQRFRVVTLRGEIVETSGAMSGGGRTQMRGKMGQKVATQTRNNTTSSPFGKKDLEQLEVRAEETQTRINYLQEQQGHLEREINQLKNTLVQKEKDVRKMMVTIRSLTEQLPRVEVQLKQQKERMEKTHSDQNKVKELEDVIKSKRSTFEKAEKVANKITEKIKEINKKISDIHGDKIKSVQQKIDQITKQITNLNGNISKLNVAIITSGRNLQKTTKQIEDLKDEIQKAQDSLTILKDKRLEYENESKELQKQIEDIKIEIEEAEKSMSSVRSEISKIQKKENELKMKRVEIEEKLQAVEKKVKETRNHLPSLQNKLKSLKLHVIQGEPTDEEHTTLKTYTEDELNGYSLQDLEYECAHIQETLQGKKPNMSVIADYYNKRDVYLERIRILEDITSKRNEMRQLYDNVRTKRYTEFMNGFHIITRKLKEMYQMITQGGDAELELCDSMDPFTEGVSFSVRPPRKTWKNISNLSGGEKTLSSLALVFALHYYKPSPLYFMDEIDAALDFKNISIVAHYIKERTKNAQFIIISLRSNMFELSDYIVGIYKVQDCTSSCTLVNYVSELSKSLSSATNNTQQHQGGNNDDGNEKSQQQIATIQNENDTTSSEIIENNTETEELNENSENENENQNNIDIDKSKSIMDNSLELNKSKSNENESRDNAADIDKSMPITKDNVELNKSKSNENESRNNAADIDKSMPITKDNVELNKSKNNENKEKSSSKNKDDSSHEDKRNHEKTITTIETSDNDINNTQENISPPSLNKSTPLTRSTRSRSKKLNISTSKTPAKKPLENSQMSPDIF